MLPLDKHMKKMNNYEEAVAVETVQDIKSELNVKLDEVINKISMLQHDKRQLEYDLKREKYRDFRSGIRKAIREVFGKDYTLTKEQRNDLMAQVRDVIRESLQTRKVTRAQVLSEAHYFDGWFSGTEMERAYFHDKNVQPGPSALLFATLIMLSESGWLLRRDQYNNGSFEFQINKEKR